MPPERDAAAVDELLGALASRRNRLVVGYLRDSSGGTTSHEELAEYLSDQESRAPDRRELLVHLHHVCLPKLEEAGLLQRDPRNETVRYRPDPGALRILNSIDD